MAQVIGIMGAMHEEINGVIELMQNRESFDVGMRTYYRGAINGHKVVVVFSRWGKVAAAATVATLILEFGITELIFTGVAGAIDERLKVGDVVVAKRLVQHDMDARPILKRFELPLIGKEWLEVPDRNLDRAVLAVNDLIDKKHWHQLFLESDINHFAIENPTLWVGDIASGDSFFSSNLQRDALRSCLPTVLCVEMEGAAVAQVCYEYDIPFAIIRTISDGADDTSHIDFQSFVDHVASKCSVEIIKNILK